MASKEAVEAAASERATPDAKIGAPGRGGRALEPARQASEHWWLSSWWLVGFWLPVAVISSAHYATEMEHLWIHDVLRRMYYLPILFAAFGHGLRGGLAAAALISLTYLPHAFFAPAMMDPASGLEKMLELVLYHVVGAVAGHLTDQERRRRAELQRALEQQQHLTRQLVRAGRLSALGEVVAGIAHEIKNPLHTLLGTAEIVDPLIPGDVEERRIWELHVAEIHRLGRAAERFLSFARPHPLEVGPLDLREVAHRLIELVQAQALQTRVAISFVPPAEEVRVRGDRDQLTQIVLNIALNGLKAMGEQGGHLRIAVIPQSQKSAGMHLIRLENDGPKIPEEELEHIFDPFHSGRDDGTGLGLSISERIAEQHHGYIEAANDGLGVSFSVYLPAI